MNEIEKINNTELTVKVYQYQRVVTFKDIDMVHERPEGTARKRFNDNKKYFIEGEDFYILDQPSEIRTLGIERPQGGTPDKILLITESGYLMLVKSFTDDLAWDVQRQLVKSYFRKPVLKLPKLVCMADVEEKEPYARIYKTDSGGIVLMNDMVFNLAPSEMEHLSRFISELEKQDIEHIEYVVSSFLKSMKKSRKLEEMASWGLKQEEEQKTLLQDKAIQHEDIR